MANVKVTLDVEQELWRRVEWSATTRNENVREWVHRAILRELEPKGDKAEQTLNQHEKVTFPATGGKPRGRRIGAPTLQGDETMADAVIRDRR